MEFFSAINEFRRAIKRITIEYLARRKMGSAGVWERLPLIEKIPFCANIAADEESSSLRFSLLSGGGLWL
jgi:hypothetical protein